MDRLIDFLVRHKDDQDIKSLFITFNGITTLTIKFSDGTYLELVEKRLCEHTKQNLKK